MEEEKWAGINVEELFGHCDLDRSGYIDKHELAAVCDLDDNDLNEIFYQLDLDNDGRISVDEFSKNFQNFSDVVADLKSAKQAESKNVKSRKGLTAFKNGLGMDSTLVTSQQYISELYYNLTNSNQPDLLDLFEKHLANVVKDIKSKAAENQRLEEALKRATKQHARQVNNLDREVEQQMEKLEAKVRHEEKSSYEKKLSDFEWQLEGKDKEISAMNRTIDTLQTRLDKETNKPNTRREEIENVGQENRYLKSQVTDSQTTLALLRSELAELKSQFVEQSNQLQKEQRTAQASFQEQENLARQLQLLYEANQRLQDVNDELRGALEAKNNSSPERKTSEVLKLSGVFTTPPAENRELSSSVRSNGFARSNSPLAGSRLPDYHAADYNDNTLNEDSLFSEIHRASTTHYEDLRTSNETNTTNDDDDDTNTDDNENDLYKPTPNKTDRNSQISPNLEHQNALAKIMNALSTRNRKLHFTNNAKLTNFNKSKKQFQKMLVEKSKNTDPKKTDSNFPSNVFYSENSSTLLEETGSHGLDHSDFVSIFYSHADLRKCETDLKGYSFDVTNSTFDGKCEIPAKIIAAKEGKSMEQLNYSNLHNSSKETLTENQALQMSKKENIIPDNLQNGIENHKSCPSYLSPRTSSDELTYSPNTSAWSQRLHTKEECDDSFECSYGEFERDLNAGYNYMSSSDSFVQFYATHFLSTEPYKSDSEEEDEAYSTLSKSRKAEVQKQIQILEDTNKRLGSSNDELRVALKMMARSGSFRKPKKTPSGNSRRTQSSHSDYGSLSSNRSSRNFSPKHKSLSNGDVGEETDESTTYDVEEENVGTIAEESIKDLAQENKETAELADDHSVDYHIIENTTELQNNHPYEDKTKAQEKRELGSQSLKLKDVIVDRTDYDSCLVRPSSEKGFRTRSKSLELFYIENLAKLKSCETNGLENSVEDEFGDTEAFEKSENEHAIRSSELEENNNNDKGLWEITKKLNAYERIRASLEELSCIEEEGSNKGESSEQEESEGEEESENFIEEEPNKEKLTKNSSGTLKVNEFKKKESERRSLEKHDSEEEPLEEELVEEGKLEEKKIEKKSTRELVAELKEQKCKKERLEAEKQGKGNMKEHKFNEVVRKEIVENGYKKVKLKENGPKQNGLRENELMSDEEQSYEEESENESDQDEREESDEGVREEDSDEEHRKNDEGEQKKRAEESKEKRTVSFNDTREYEDDYDDSYEEDSEYSSDEEMSDSSTEQRQDSTATMNSETIADLQAQFQKIKESKEPDEEEEKSDGDDVEDEDDDLMNSAELAELVAMASDLTDVSDSESETGKSATSTKTEEIATMTSENFSASYSTPERMYKLVLAGDAAVGKSSFILRLCKNKFHSSLNATLGVDFQVKNIKVDAKTVALQLWDTAGQERFRSIAKSYFRKVDGVLLLYDVTCESSFINIRDWMSTIEESSQKKVPIMLCGNKCDLRDEYIREGRKVVSTESGQRLATHYDALFIETSAKDGKHIERACKELARILTSLENEEIEQCGLKLDKKDREKKKRPCCPS